MRLTLDSATEAITRHLLDVAQVTPTFADLPGAKLEGARRVASFLFSGATRDLSEAAEYLDRRHWKVQQRGMPA